MPLDKIGPGPLTPSAAGALTDTILQVRDHQARLDAIRPPDDELVPVRLTDYATDSGAYSWIEQGYNQSIRYDKLNGMEGTPDYWPAFSPNGEVIAIPAEGVQAFIRAASVIPADGPTPSKGMGWEIVGIVPGATSGACTACGWLRDRQSLIDGGRILKVKFFGNRTPLGRCACFPDQGGNPTPLIAVYDAGSDFWVSWFNEQTCCSCGSMAINITGVPIDPITGDLAPIILAELVINHGCDGGGQYVYDLVFECCTGDTATFTGYGPKNCDESMPADGWPCDNTFKVEVTCSPCDVKGVSCPVCRENCAPPYFEIPYNPDDPFTGAYSDYNGPWFLQPDPDVACLWSVKCGDILITATLTVGDDGNAVITVVYSGGAGGTLTYIYHNSNSLEGNPYPTFLCFMPSFGLALQGGYHSGAAGSINVSALYCTPCALCCPSTKSLNFLWTMTGTPPAVAACPGYTVSGTMNFFGLVDPIVAFPLHGPNPGHPVRLWTASASDVPGNTFFWCDPTTGFYSWQHSETGDCISPGGGVIFATNDPAASSAFYLIVVTCDPDTGAIAASGFAYADCFWTACPGTLVITST